ncbi:MAG: HEPN domain-containing protein [Acidimicrobiales bacterium]
MVSSARKAFDQNCEDIERLLEIHKDLGGSGPGRRRRLEVLNKSAIVLLTALWEGYCEDIAAEGVAHFVNYARNHKKLPLDLQKRLAKELKAEPDELSVWKVADDGWRACLTARLATWQEDRNRRLNTPKSANIDEMFKITLGIPRISSFWYWSAMSAEQARGKLDRYVELRGAIAHRGGDSRSINKTAVTDYYNHIRRLVSKTGGRVNSVARTGTGTPLWR